MSDTRQIIANNLTKLRKSKNLTQVELAEKMNYSDKAVSRWEKGDTLPDISVLCEICKFYGITLNDLVNENLELNSEEKNKEMQKFYGYRAWLCALCVSVVWLCATIMYIYTQIISDTNYWISFIWAIPISCTMVFLTTKGMPHRMMVNLISSSIFSWSLIAGIYLHNLQYNLWPIFIIGIPVQLVILISCKIHSLRLK